MEFPIQFYTGIIKGWKKKTMQFVDNGIKIIEKGTNQKGNDTIYPLRGAVINESIKKNNNTLELELINRRIFIQAFSPKEKQIIKDKLRKHINTINENKSFSQEFNEYCSEINKIEEENPSDSIFKNVESSISFLISYFLELHRKIDDFRTIIDTTKLSKTNKAKFNDICISLECIDQNMKSRFDELVKSLYDYHDCAENIFNNSEMIDPANFRACTLYEKEDSSKNVLKLNKENKENSEIDTKNFVKIFEKDPLYDFHRNKLEKEIILDKNMVQEIVKAFSSGQKTLPIKFGEPINILQRECERFKFCDYFNKAANESSIEMKFANIAAFLTAEMSLNIGRLLKPMVPLVGETYEFVDNELKYKYFAEEVQRKPNHISAYIAEGEKWKYFADNRNVTNFKFFAGSYIIDFENKIHLQLLKNNCKKEEYDNFIFNRPSCVLKGILTNKLHYDFTGEITIKCIEQPDIICVIEYMAQTSEIEEGTISGKISKEDTDLFLLGGNWKTELYMTDTNGENKKILFSIQDEEFLKNSPEKYVMPQYSCNLNFINDQLKEVLPICDTRFRPDQREYESGNTEKSQEIKDIIEAIQNQKQEELDQKNEEHKPIYFSNEYSEESNDFIYLYKGGYWEDRKNKKFTGKVSDIFDLSVYKPPEPEKPATQP